MIIVKKIDGSLKKNRNITYDWSEYKKIPDVYVYSYPGFEECIAVMSIKIREDGEIFILNIKGEVFRYLKDTFIISNRSFIQTDPSDETGRAFRTNIREADDNDRPTFVPSKKSHFKFVGFAGE